MLVRHCVEESNVDENLLVIDPAKIRHVVVSAGKIMSMSGFIDPASHLNLDFPDHRVNKCIIAEKFEEGSAVKIVDQGFVFAMVPDSAYDHHGYVDYTDRLIKMIEAVRAIRKPGTRSRMDNNKNENNSNSNNNNDTILTSVQDNNSNNKNKNKNKNKNDNDNDNNLSESKDTENMESYVAYHLREGNAK